jgi:hypothetical protein
MDEYDTEDYERPFIDALPRYSLSYRRFGVRERRETLVFHPDGHSSRRPRRFQVPKMCSLQGFACLIRAALFNCFEVEG